MFGWFKKKAVEAPKPKKMDLSKYRMDFTIKAICMYERLSGRSFFDFAEEDIAMLLYCTFYVSNDIEIKYSIFQGILENPQFATWAASKYNDILEVMKQFKKEGNDDEGGSGTTKMSMTDLATSLIIDYHVDAHYVMYEMNIWEVEPLYEACDTMVKKRYEEERLWTYIQVLPQIDGKKIKGPDQLIPFPWEKEVKKKRTEENLKNNTYAVKNLIGRNINDILKKDGR